MLFWISIAFVVAPVFGAIGMAVTCRHDHDPMLIDAAAGFVGGVVVALISVPALVSWETHADDVSKVEAQHHRITVYEERIESLERRLSEFDYPEKPSISLDADTPWATMVRSLNDAESELASAKDERAIAIRSIRARMRGPMSGVVDFVGLPDGMKP